jgi:hypothetical protein
LFNKTEEKLSKPGIFTHIVALDDNAVKKEILYKQQLMAQTQKKKCI